MTQQFSLLRSGSLVLDVADACMPLVRPWIPLNGAGTGPSTVPQGDIRSTMPRANVVCRPEQSEGTVPATPLIHLTSVTAAALTQDRIAMHGASNAHGLIDLASLHAELALAETTPDGAADAWSMLTLSAAFLLGRMQHALMHAGAVVDPEGHAWLLVGDTHAGKTTTVVSLVEAGWSYLADDQVVVSRGESGEVMVEGWPRIAHLDEGWSTGIITGSRGAVDLRDRYSSRLLRTAPLGGVLLPAIRPDDKTSAHAAHPAAAFSALVRQSPWLMADPGAAPVIASLLTSIAATRPHTLVLGADSYARGEVIAACLDQASRRASAQRDP